MDLTITLETEGVDDKTLLDIRKLAEEGREGIISDWRKGWVLLGLKIQDGGPVKYSQVLEPLKDVSPDSFGDSELVDDVLRELKDDGLVKEKGSNRWELDI